MLESKRREDITQINDNLLISRYLLIASKYNRVLRELAFPDVMTTAGVKPSSPGFPPATYQRSNLGTVWAQKNASEDAFIC